MAGKNDYFPSSTTISARVVAMRRGLGDAKQALRHAHEMLGKPLTPELHSHLDTLLGDAIDAVDLGIEALAESDAMTKTITVKLTVTDEQLAALKAFAATYHPELGMTWRNVAGGWAQGGFDEYLAEHIERQKKTVEAK